jgi:LacI family transcriptional regulator
LKSKPIRVALMLDLDWPYKRSVGTLSGMQRYAEQQGWESTVDAYLFELLTSSPTPSSQFNGIIGLATKQLAECAARLCVPLVNIWFQSPVRDTLPGVFPDYLVIARLRAEHLLTRGFRNFATVISHKVRAENLEEKEFRSTLGERAYSYTSANVEEFPWKTSTQWQKNRRVLADKMNDWQLPIGVYVGEENVGRMVMQICHDRGLRVPEDVAIIAGYNEDAICEYPRPSLTSVDLGYERIGYEAARQLHRLMDGKTPPSEHVLLPPTGLVVRDSTDFFAVNDKVVAAALEFIAKNSHRPIRADDVAKAVATGTRTLQLRFRQYLDRPIATEIRRVRFERAKRELSQSKRSIAEIARRVGFGKAVRMSDVFNRNLGMTPRQYRHQQQCDE